MFDDASFCDVIKPVTPTGQLLVWTFNKIADSYKISTFLLQRFSTDNEICQVLVQKPLKNISYCALNYDELMELCTIKWNSGLILFIIILQSGYCNYRL